MQKVFTSLITLTLVATPIASLSAQDTTAPTQLERVKAETDLEKAKAERARAEAERVKALGLPSFDGKTELGQNAGAMEATLLTSSALGALATAIASDVDVMKLDRVLVLTRDETLDAGQAASLELEIRAITQLYEQAGIKHTGQFVTAGGAIAAMSAFAGMIRSDASLSYIDVGAVDDRMLAWAVATKIGGGKAILPSAALGAPIGPAGQKLLMAFDGLSTHRILAEAQRRELATKDKLKGDEKLLSAALEVAITRHDAFFTKMTTPNDKGVVPLLAAARLADLFTGATPILRLHVDKAGGSLVNTKNMFTTLGVDPLKVSGGILASFALTTPATGAVQKADVISCQTTLTGIRRVQERTWKPRSTPCRSVLTGR